MSDRGSWNVLLSHPDVKYPENVERHSARIPDVGYPEKMERRKGDHSRVHGVGTHPEQLHPDSPSGHATRSPIRTPSGRSTRHSQSSHPDDSISYPNMLSGSLTNVSKPCYSIRTACHRPCSAAILSGHLLLLAFRICLWQRTSKLRFFMFLSFPLLCHGFQRTLLNLGLLWWSKSYQNTKT